MAGEDSIFNKFHLEPTIIDYHGLIYMVNIPREKLLGIYFKIYPFARAHNFRHIVSYGDYTSYDELDFIQDDLNSLRCNQCILNKIIMACLEDMEGNPIIDITNFPDKLAYFFIAVRDEISKWKIKTGKDDGFVFDCIQDKYSVIIRNMIGINETITSYGICFNHCHLVCDIDDEYPKHNITLGGGAFREERIMLRNIIHAWTGDYFSTKKLLEVIEIVEKVAVEDTNAEKFLFSLCRLRDVVSKIKEFIDEHDTESDFYEKYLIHCLLSKKIFCYDIDNNVSSVLRALSKSSLLWRCFGDNYDPELGGVEFKKGIDPKIYKQMTRKLDDVQLERLMATLPIDMFIREESSIENPDVMFNSIYLNRKLRKMKFRDSYKDFVRKNSDSIETSEVATGAGGAAGCSGYDDATSHYDEDDLTKTYTEINTKVIPSQLKIIKNGKTIDIRKIIHKKIITYEELTHILPFATDVEIKTKTLLLSSVIDHPESCQEYLCVPKSWTIRLDTINIDNTWRNVNTIIPLPHLWYGKMNPLFENGYIFVFDTDHKSTGMGCHQGFVKKEYHHLKRLFQTIEKTETMKFCEKNKAVRGHYLNYNPKTGRVNCNMMVRVKINDKTYTFQLLH